MSSKNQHHIEKLIKPMGGSVESFYFAFGDIDAFVILDMPDNVSVAAVAMAVNQSGAATVRTTVLLTLDDVDAAIKQLPAYRPPGQ
ncbi:MAG: GYD domain-containing protein [Polaromonas sp.]